MYYAVWSKEEKPGLTHLTHHCLDSECRAIGALLLHERDRDEREALQRRFLLVNELRAVYEDGFKVYVSTNNVTLDPTDGGAMELDFEDWVCDIPS